MEENDIFLDPADIREELKEDELAYELDISPLYDMQEKAEKNGHWRC